MWTNFAQTSNSVSLIIFHSDNYIHVYSFIFMYKLLKYCPSFILGVSQSFWRLWELILHILDGRREYMPELVIFSRLTSRFLLNFLWQNTHLLMTSLFSYLLKLLWDHVEFIRQIITRARVVTTCYVQDLSKQVTLLP